VVQQFETAELMPPAVHDRLTGELVCHGRSVVHLEWVQMQEGRDGDTINPWSVALFRSLRIANPNGATEEAAYGKWLDQTSDREEARRDRLPGGEGIIPVRRPRRSGRVLMDDPRQGRFDRHFELRRPRSLRSRRSRPPGRPTSRRGGTAGRRGRRALRSLLASSRRVRRAWRIGTCRSTSRCSPRVDAYARDEAELAAFYRKRFRAEFQPAFQAWVATKPRTNPDAPLSPFAMPQYKLAETAKTDRLEAKAAAFSVSVGNFIQRADNYSLAVVLFAASLFFAGISTRLRSPTPRIVILGLGYTLFLGSLIWIATFPVSLSV